MNDKHSWIQTCFADAAKIAVVALTVIALTTVGEVKAADEYWRTDGVSAVWTNSSWGTSTNGPFASGWTAGNNAIFSTPATASNLITYVSKTVIGNVTANGNTLVTEAGTLSNGMSISTFTVSNGVTLTWQGQTISTAAGTGFTKAGYGTWDMSSEGGAYPGGFTLNAGTVIVSAKNSFGNGGMTINGGLIQSSGSSTFAPSSLTLGGDFTFAGTGQDTWGMSVNLGAATRNITNATSTGGAIRLLGGIISGSAGAGLSFWGSGSGTINLTNPANSFTGPININGAEVQFQNDGSYGAAPGSATAGAIVVDGGRLTAADGGQNGVVYTLNANRGIQFGATPGTSISVTKSTGFLGYAGIIADKPGSTGMLVKQGGGVLSLGGTNTYSGGTFINNGTVQLTNGSNLLPVGTTVSLGQVFPSGNVGTLDLDGCSQQITGLNSIYGTNNLVTAKNIVTNSASTAATLTIMVSNATVCAYGDGSLTNSGIVAGAINLVLNGPGTQILGDSNTYTGRTTVSAGTLRLSGAGSISSTPEITVASGAILDVSALTNDTLTLAVGQTLDGFGTVNGMVTTGSGSTLTPGSPSATGTVTVLSNVTLNGTTMMKLNQSGATNDVLSVTGTLTYGGTLTVTNLSGTLVAGNSFSLFNASTITGSFSATNLPALGGGLSWDTSQLTNGILDVVTNAAVPLSYLAINSFSLSGTNILIGGTNQGAGTCYVLASTNLASPLATWTAIATNELSGSGNFIFTNTANSNTAQEFFILSTTNNN